MGNWKYDRAKRAIDKRIEDVSDVVIVDYTRDMSLDSIPTNKAYRMDAVHLYADITNLDDILENPRGVEQFLHDAARTPNRRTAKG